MMDAEHLYGYVDAEKDNARNFIEHADMLEAESNGETIPDPDMDAVSKYPTNLTEYPFDGPSIMPAGGAISFGDMLNMLGIYPENNPN